jgi:tRNA-splicing endonuclease subunit Sen34
MVGGVAAFKQQNAVHGLPLELSADEVTLALERRWARLRPATGIESRALAAAPARARAKRRWDADADAGTDASSSDDGAFGSDGAPDGGEGADADNDAPWQAAVAHGAHFELPEAPPDAEAYAAAGAPAWRHPTTGEERDRYRVFRDLHARGLRATGGSKFGADLLLYPGDPGLYHAQFTCRLAPAHGRLVPALLAAACRGSFQARKHLLLASVVPPGGAAAAAAGGGGAPEVATDEDFSRVGELGVDYKILYMTLGPVEGFG